MADDQRQQNLANWFGNAHPDLQDEGGVPKRLYVGTLSDFDTFNRNKMSVQGDHGQGFYATDNPDDASVNYASQQGADLNSKVDRRMDSYYDEPPVDDETGEPLSEDEIRKLAMQDLGVQHHGAVMPVHMTMKNPLVLGGKNETVYDFHEPFDEETEEYGEPSGSLMKLIEGVEESGRQFDHSTDEIVGNLYERARNYGKIPATVAEKIIKKGFEHAYDPDTGDVAANEAWRTAVEEAGHDGIIDHTVDSKFGSSRRGFGGAKIPGMHGVIPDTTHYISFDSKKIKSATGNIGNFNPTKPRITEKRGGALTNDEGITAYHASPKQLSEFKPSGFRGSTFFASTPKRAMEGAGAGANEMVMDTATELKSGPMFIHKVNIDPSKIAGLHYTPAEKEWFHSMPSRIVGDGALEEAMEDRPNPYISWDDIYDHHKIGDRLYEYRKRREPPSVSYEQAYKTGKDVYGRQHSHYAPEGDEKKNAQRTLATGMKGHLVHDEAGLSIAMADPSHAKIKDVKHFADGGTVDDDGIDALHSSPHDFEQFDISKIGTGEGNQSFGHGLYFSENPSVSGQGGDYWRQFWNKMKAGSEQSAASALWANKFNTGKAIEALMSQHEYHSTHGIPGKYGYGSDIEQGHQELADQYKQAADMLREGKIAGPRTYEVKIAAHPDHLLDWDLPVNEQNSRVLEALLPFFPEGIPSVNKYGAPLKYGDLHNDVVKRAGGVMFKKHIDAAGVPERMPGGTEQRFSAYLHSKGIPGIKYFDAGSRGGEGGSRNYVIFDDKLVNVRRKYKQGGAV